MANLQHISSNSFIINARKTRLKVGVLGLLVIGLTILPLFFILEGYLAHLISILLVSLYVLIQKLRFAGQLNRVSGKAELNALKHIKRLPTKFVVFNQIEIPSKKSKVGHFELDLLVVSPTGIYIIESKKYSGKITGGNFGKWKRIKIDKYGNEHEETKKNPINQVSYQSDVVAEFLANFGIKSPIRGIVYMDGLEKDSEFENNLKFPIFSNKEIIKYILNVEQKSETINGKNKGKENYFNITELFRLLRNKTIQ